MEENSNAKKKSRKMPAITSDGKLRIKELLTERGLKLQELANKTQKEASKIYQNSIKKATIKFGKDNNLIINLNFEG